MKKIELLKKKIFSSGLFLILFILSGINLSAQYPRMLLVTGGKYMMGNLDGSGYEDEKPPHEESVKTFWIAKYETTVAEYKYFCKETARDMPPAPSWQWEGKENYPIVNVTWQDANSYCEWLSKKTGKKYRLPTEQEWEFAAKGGKMSKGYKFSGSNNPEEVAWYDEKIVDEKTEKTVDQVGAQEVGKLKPNELGLYDMSGNVWEWCSNNYDYYDGSSEELIFPPGGKKQKMKVLRGGSWYYELKYARVTAREGPFATKINPNFGFRVARDE